MTDIHLTRQLIASNQSRIAPVSEPNSLSDVRHAMLRALTLIGLGLAGVA